MKNYIAILTLLSLALGACTTSKKKASDSTGTSTAPQQAEDATKTMPKGDANGANTSMAFINMDMFGELEMTEKQISRYKSGMIAFQKKKVNMPNGEMLGDMPNERTRQLEKILSEEQFAKYQKWQRANE